MCSYRDDPTWRSDRCACCGSLLPIAPNRPAGYCDLCDGGPNVMSSPPHVCVKSGRVIGDEDGCPPGAEVPEAFRE